MKLQWIGDGRSEAFETLIFQATKPAYPTCRPRVCFVSKPAFPSCLENALPIHDRSNVIYNFECQCGGQYIGKTIQRLEARIKQHIPAYVLEPGKNAKKKTTQPKKKENNDKEEGEEEHKAPDSSIGEHLVANIACLNAYDWKQFTILTVGRTQSKLDTPEALVIKKFKLQTSANKKSLSVVYTFSSHTFYTCTHMHTPCKKTSHSHSFHQPFQTHTYTPFVTPPTHTHTCTNLHSAIHDHTSLSSS